MRKSIANPKQKDNNDIKNGAIATEKNKIDIIKNYNNYSAKITIKISVKMRPKLTNKK